MRTYLKRGPTGTLVWAEPNETDPFLNGLNKWARMDLTIDENPWQVTFATLDGIDLKSGIWNKSAARLEC